MNKWYLSTQDQEGVEELASNHMMAELAKIPLNIPHVHQRL